MCRTIFIGDLHGIHDETVELLKKLQLTPNDWVIFLGDYVDRGRENAKCCDLVREREQVQGRVAGILGNHEETHVRHEDHFRRTGSLPNMPPTHAATRAQLKPEHYDWFRSLPLYVRIPEYNHVAVHAGVWPDRSIEEQKPHHLLHIQTIRPYDEHGNKAHGEGSEKSVWPSKVPTNEPGWAFWTHFWRGPETVVFGHSVLDKPLITDKVVGIDGGGVFGRQLHAYVLPERKIVTIDCPIDYGKGRRGTQNSNIKLFPVHGDVSTFS